ncbi:MAG: ScpA family protein [Proteobacteria bacterium]|nr:ScpA family protein [Pseudomonadota bacterium]MDA1309551.1 ScpA family protein [Pseudomonadota bacterium]
MADSHDNFESPEPDYRRPREPEQLSLFLTLDGYEGPIDVLLTLGRDQKVDLTQISILQLADQYLAFIRQAQSLNLEIAADYLVMAAWLAYLKSRLLLPSTEDDEEGLSSEELADALRFQLLRLEAMRDVGDSLMARPRLGVDTFARGMPESIVDLAHPVYDVTLFELLKAYGDHKVRTEHTSLRIASTKLFAVEEAVKRLRRMLGHMPNWQTLISFLPSNLRGGLLNRSALASTFVASLELVKEGHIELRQDSAFGPIFLRNREHPR